MRNLSLIYDIYNTTFTKIYLAFSTEFHKQVKKTYSNLPRHHCSVTKWFLVYVFHYLATRLFLLVTQYFRCRGKIA